MDGNVYKRQTQWVAGKDYPEWMDEVGVATISKGYLLPDETPKKAYRRVAKAIAERINRPDLESKFFRYIWNGWIGLASPVLSNTGTDRGLPISCFGIDTPEIKQTCTNNNGQSYSCGVKATLELKKIIGSKFNVVGAVTQLGLMSCDKNNWKDSEIRKNPFFCPDKSILKLWEKYLLAVRKAGSSCGAIIELRATGIPVGLGAPIYSKLDTDISAALMSINAVKGVNIGAGMNAAFLSGEENSDEMSKGSGKVKFGSNQAGGILGGISSGQNIVASFAVKPTSSILTSRKTIDKKGKNTKISVRGRHDPCVGIRAVPIGEAMINCVLLDHYLMNRAQCG